MPTSKANRRNTIFADGSDRQSLASLRKKSDMLVVLDRDDGTYTAGDTVKGRVHIVLTQDVRVKDLILRFYGFGRVSWDEQRAYTKGSSPTVSHKNTEVYLDESTSLMKKDTNSTAGQKSGTGQSSMTSVILAATSEGSDEGVVLAAGNHSFPFEHVLPRTLPSTYEGRWGQVRYSVKAELQRPWKFNIDREAELVVKAFYDLNDEPELARPIGGLSEFRPGLMCIRSGPITVELRVGRRGYVPGDSIHTSVEIENTSRYKLYHCRLALMQHVTFRAGRKLRKTCVSVTSLDKGDVLPGTTAQWNNESLDVPTVPPTTGKGHRNIEIKYTISLFVKYSSWTDPFCLPVTVSIGTVALRRQTINTYLAMLGYGQTPKGSPSTGRKTSVGDQSMAIAARSPARQSLSLPVSGPGPRRSSNPTVTSGITGVRESPRQGQGQSSSVRSADKQTHQSSNSSAGRTRCGSTSVSAEGRGGGAGGRVKLGQIKSKSRSQDSSDGQNGAVEREREGQEMTTTKV